MNTTYYKVQLTKPLICLDKFQQKMVLRKPRDLIIVSESSLKFGLIKSRVKYNNLVLDLEGIVLNEVQKFYVTFGRTDSKGGFLLDGYYATIFAKDHTKATDFAKKAFPKFTDVVYENNLPELLKKRFHPNGNYTTLPFFFFESF